MTIRLYYYFTSMNPTPCKGGAELPNDGLLRSHVGSHAVPPPFRPGIVERLSLAEEFSTLPVNPGDHADMSLICNEVEELPKGVSDVKKFKLACRTPTLTHALGAVKARWGGGGRRVRRQCFVCPASSSLWPILVNSVCCSTATLRVCTTAWSRRRWLVRPG